MVLGYSQKEIAETYGFSRGRANQLVLKAVDAGLCDGKGVVELKRSEDELRAGMTPEMLRIVEEAPALAEEGLTKTQAAKRLGVSQKKLSRVTIEHLGWLKWRDGRGRGSA